MKKLLWFFLFFIFILPIDLLQAQNFILGARGGISIPNLTAGGSKSNPLNTGYSSRFGPDVALTGELKFSQHFSLETMIEYSSQGGKKNGFQALTVPEEYIPAFPAGQVPPYLYADYKSEAKLKYLLVPILGKFSWKLGPQSPLKGYLDAGPFAGYLLSAKQVTRGSSIIYADPQKQNPLTPTAQSFDDKTDIANQLNKFNFGVSGNVGLGYHFNRSVVFIEGGGNYGFLNIQKGEKNGKNHTGAGTVGIGYGYLLDK
jgi:hypothetical protein